MRQKWSSPIRTYWKQSERLKVETLVTRHCGIKNMGKYIYEEYVSIFRTAQGAMATNYQMLIWSLLGAFSSLSLTIAYL